MPDISDEASCKPRVPEELTQTDQQGFPKAHLPHFESVSKFVLHIRHPLVQSNDTVAIEINLAANNCQIVASIPPVSPSEAATKHFVWVPGIQASNTSTCDVKERNCVGIV